MMFKHSRGPALVLLIALLVPLLGSAAQAEATGTAPSVRGRRVDRASSPTRRGRWRPSSSPSARWRRRSCRSW